MLATLDTKGEEARFVRVELEAQMVRVVVIDVRVGADSAPSYETGRPAHLGESTPAGEIPSTTLAASLEAKGLEVNRLLRIRQEAGELDAVLAIGGGKGTVIACLAMSDLRYDIPKVVVSSARSDVLGRVTGTSNIVLFPAVVDLNGLNTFTRVVLAQAARAVCGMMGVRQEPTLGPTIAISAFGATTPAVGMCRAHLADSGAEAVVFPATGTGGLAMEGLVREGIFKVVLDLTTTELADSLLGGFGSAGPHRLEAAGEMGLPQVVAPGAMDMINFGPPATVPRKYRARKLYFHSPQTTLVRTTPAENRKLGAIVGRKLRRARGPVVVLVPMRGFSSYDSASGPFYDPDSTTAWVVGLQHSLRGSGVDCRLLDCHINDPAFAAQASARAVDYLGRVR